MVVLVTGGIVLMIVALLTLVIAGPLLKPKYIRNGSAAFKGAGPLFLESLPPSPVGAE